MSTGGDREAGPAGLADQLSLGCMTPLRSTMTLLRGTAQAGAVTLPAALLTTLAMVGIGYGAAVTTNLHRVDNSSGYFLLATILLAIGLFSSTYDIAVDELKRNVRVVLVAVTLGVLAKAILITVIMYLVFSGQDSAHPAYLVLGVAMAQIDPLSVAMTRHQSQLSSRARVILSAWSSLDDPMTAILAIYLSSFMLTNSVVSPEGSPGNGGTESVSGLSNVVNGLLGNGLLVLGAAVIWVVLSGLAKTTQSSITSGAQPPPSHGLRLVGIVALVTIAAVAVDNFWMLGLAAVGLFFRPGIGKILSLATLAAFAVATFVLGIVLADGVHLVPGIVLGIATFTAQIVVGTLVTWRLSRRDSLRLALGQQSGITAVILALLLETMFPGTVAIVAPAILVINTLHLVSNTLLNKAEKTLAARRTTPAEGGADLCEAPSEGLAGSPPHSAGFNTGNHIDQLPQLAPNPTDLTP